MKPMQNELLEKMYGNYLLGQLTSGSQNDDTRCTPELLPGVCGIVRKQSLHNGQHKGQGFALSRPAISGRILRFHT